MFEIGLKERKQQQKHNKSDGCEDLFKGQNKGF